jgi:hypothetical protein
VNDRVCPSCGKAALSVATRCPRCGYAFDARYDRHIDPKPHRRRLPAGPLILLAVLTVVAANFLWKSGRAPSHLAVRPPASTTPAPVQPAPLAQTTPAPAETVASSAPITTPPAESVTVHRPAAETARVASRQPVVASPKPPAPVPASLPLSGNGERRFATTWINVRAVRSNKSRVVRVLRPGEAVQVDSLGQGWYRIIAEEPGYADRRLLASAPPPPTP